MKLFACPEPDCDMHRAGFPTEEACNAHVQEEHVKPNEDPMRFMQDNLLFSLALDSNKIANAKSGGQEAGQSSAPAMNVSLSKQGQTPSSKPDFAATPMSRDASMRRQGSAAGAIKSEGTPKFTDSKPPIKQEVDAPLQHGLMEDPWANSTIDPQNLFAGFAPLDSVAGGMLADFSAYRSSTPNDTPESSKDSGASEPNSDISEGANIDIDLSWQQMDSGDVLYDMANFSMEGFDPLDSDFMGAESLQLSSLDDMTNDFSKPFHFDSSLYSMDT